MIPIAKNSAKGIVAATISANFEDQDIEKLRKEQCCAFTEMVAAMRQDTLGSSSVAQADLEAVLLGVRRAT